VSLRVDVVTIFPGMVEAPLADGIVGRARAKGLLEIAVHDLRQFTDDRHRTVDDAPFGGGPGMVMKAEPFFRAVESLLPSGRGRGDAVVLLSPRGRRFEQATAERYARLDRLLLLCGRYEGVDERVREGLTAEEVSIGDFVLTGGEVAAAAIVEATVRLLPGALGHGESAQRDSFSAGILGCPHYTRPALVRGLGVPEELLSGDHQRVARWRRKEALRATLERRPELLERARLDAGDEVLLREIENESRCNLLAPR
jgi:tRNA (guanine37-N1)-methyltransferase